jgi:hypothetical protein
MATKTATVQSGQVTGTHTNFPAYVDLSDAGITTLAEAQSVRVYSDAGLTTELAREIVSATEMHVKIPSMTSSTQIWIDYDGVRSDLAVSATYGRNAVWSDYAYVYHLETDGTDSTGNDDLVDVGTITHGAQKIGGGVDIIATSYMRGATSGSSFITDQHDLTFQLFFNPDNAGSFEPIWQLSWASNPAIQSGARQLCAYGWTDSNYNLVENNVVAGDTNIALSNGTWKLFHTVVDGVTAGNIKTWADGVAGSSLSFGSLEDMVGGIILNGRRESTSTTPGEGQYDEVRVRNGAIDGDWAATESNNLNDNSAFWGTWTDAGGGGPTANNSARRMLLMQM